MLRTITTAPMVRSAMTSAMPGGAPLFRKASALKGAGPFFGQPSRPVSVLLSGNKFGLGFKSREATALRPGNQPNGQDIPAGDAKSIADQVVEEFADQVAEQLVDGAARYVAGPEEDVLMAAHVPAQQSGPSERGERTAATKLSDQLPNPSETKRYDMGQLRPHQLQMVSQFI